MKVDVKKGNNSQVDINVVIDAKDFEKYRDAVTKKALDQIEVDGFRKGKAPQDVAMQKIDPAVVLDQMAQQAISDAYLDILKDQDIKAIGQPQIMITKIAPDNDLEFTIVTGVLPEINLGDYKGAAKKANGNKEEVSVTDEEVADAITNIRKMRAQQDMMHKQTEEKLKAMQEQTEEQGDTDNSDNAEDADLEKEADALVEDVQEVQAPASWNDIKDEDLPELTDEWVQEIGPFENVDDFKTKLKENIQAEKEGRELEKQRIAVIDSILDQADIEVPQMMIDYELEKMMQEFEHNINMTGMGFDDYLKSIGKSRDDYRNEWQEQANKRAQTQLMLNAVVEAEDLHPSDEDIEKEVNAILQQYQNNPNISENSVRAYVSNILSNQKVLEFLEQL